MKHGLLFGAALLASGSVCSPAAAQASKSDVSAPPTSGADRGSMAAIMGEFFTAEPLTPEQEARLPLARQVVGTMTPDGFYADVMDKMMASSMKPLLDMLGDEGMVEEALTRQVGLSYDAQPDLSEDERAQVLAVLDPAAKDRAAITMGSMTGLMRDLGRRFEAPLREGLVKAFAVRFNEAELRDVQRFFATPSGVAFARQTIALYSDPQVMGAMTAIMPQVLESVPQMLAEVEKSTANLPKQRTYAELSIAQRQQLARLLGMSEAQLRRAMTQAEQERDKAQGTD